MPRMTAIHPPPLWTTSQTVPKGERRSGRTEEREGRGKGGTEEREGRRKGRDEGKGGTEEREGGCREAEFVAVLECAVVMASHTGTNTRVVSASASTSTFISVAVAVAVSVSLYHLRRPLYLLPSSPGCPRPSSTYVSTASGLLYDMLYSLSSSFLSDVRFNGFGFDSV